MYSRKIEVTATLGSATISNNRCVSNSLLARHLILRNYKEVIINTNEHVN